MPFTGARPARFPVDGLVEQSTAATEWQLLKRVVHDGSRPSFVLFGHGGVS